MMNQKSNRKLQLVVSISPDSYKPKDIRLNKPLFFIRKNEGIITGSMLVQDIDDVKIRNDWLTYFSPNNVAILLSVSNKALVTAKTIFKERFDPQERDLDFQNIDEDKHGFLDAKSKDVCDYIEAVQTSIIFGYTAVEAFSNLSIPVDYEYQVKIKSRGTSELYDKNAIERWLSLKEKVMNILPAIYKTSKIEKTKSWNLFLKLEKYRHEIIHQKTISSTAFYKAYFKKDIFNICESAEQIIMFFYDQYESNNRTNPLWPWLSKRKNYFPVSQAFNSEYFEVIGNLYEGYKK